MFNNNKTRDMTAWHLHESSYTDEEISGAYSAFNWLMGQMPTEEEAIEAIAKQIFIQHRGGLPEVYDKLDDSHLDKEPCLQQAKIAVDAIIKLSFHSRA